MRTCNFTDEFLLVVESFNFCGWGKSLPLFLWSKETLSPADSIIVNSSAKVSKRFVSIDSSNRGTRSFSLTSFSYIVLFINCISLSFFFIFSLLVISYFDCHKLVIFWQAVKIIHRRIISTSTIHSMRCDIDALWVRCTNCCFFRLSEQFEWTRFNEYHPHRFPSLKATCHSRIYQKISIYNALYCIL